MTARRILKWLGLVTGGLLGIALLAIAIVYLVVGRDLSATFDVRAAGLSIPVTDGDVAEGERLARIRGCFNGCHGETLNGEVFFDLPDGTVLVAPDLAAAARTLSTEELERIIRHGVRPDGTSVILAMPSEMFYHLSDDDTASIIRFLREQPAGDEPLPATRFGPLGRLLLMLFKQETGTILAAETIPSDEPRLDPSPDDPVAFGKYLAMTSCTECHGADLRGWPSENIPPLSVVVAYSPENFMTLLRTGVPIGDRELDLMALVSVKRFSHFTDSEIAALHAYLRTLASS
ncbi:MAG: c-type cytochrome [Woeseiaceae bacterium]|nr:c-type cytochrome [Woeseiaceae bacterium]